MIDSVYQHASCHLKIVNLSELHFSIVSSILFLNERSMKLKCQINSVQIEREHSHAIPILKFKSEFKCIHTYFRIIFIYNLV